MLFPPYLHRRAIRLTRFMVFKDAFKLREDLAPDYLAVAFDTPSLLFGTKNLSVIRQNGRKWTKTAAKSA